MGRQDRRVAIDPDEEEAFRRHAEAMYDEFIAKNGARFEPGVVASNLGTAHECWTNAWKRAVKNPRLRYVEGFAYLRPEGLDDLPVKQRLLAAANGAVVHRHAFCIGPDNRVIEVTKGYEDVLSYAGVVLDTAAVTDMREFTDQHEEASSVLQVVLPIVNTQEGAKEYLYRLLGVA